MKNTIKIFAVFVLLMSGMISCGKWINEIFGEELPTNLAIWNVVNNTDRELYFKRLTSQGLAVDDHIIPGETAHLTTLKLRQSSEYNFYIIEEFLPHYNPLSLYLKDGDVLLYTWTIEGKDGPGKQFFNESSWTVETIRDGRERIWTFEINPEDIP